jgi:hypothetical protein
VKLLKNLNSTLRVKLFMNQTHIGISIFLGCILVAVAIILN